MPWNDGIGGVHLEIAASTARRIGVLAGPGTGKTKYGLMRRVVRLLEGGTDPTRILLISFTRVAAADLRDKIADLDAPGAEQVRATTLHGYCFGLLQQEAVLAVTGRVPRILLSHEEDLMLRDIGGDYGNIYDRRTMLEAFVAGWARNPDAYPGIPGTDAERGFQSAVLLWLRRHKAMLIGEVIPEVFKYLGANPHSDALREYDHIIVDEYQDLNALEQQLLDRLSENGSLCIAGDDDQSIYSVRHAHPAGIHSFLARPEVETHTIATCGRCATGVLSIANSLIGCAPDRNKEPLRPLEEAVVGTVSIVQWSHTSVEVDGIVSAIAQDIAQRHIQPGHILVLTNWADLGKQIRDKLKGLEIAAKSYFKEQALRNDECREAIALLRLVCTPKDLSALRVLLASGDADGRSTAYRRVVAAADAQGVDVWTLLERSVAGQNFGLNARAIVDRFSGAMNRTGQIRGLTVPEMVEALLPEHVEHLSDLRAIALDLLADVGTATELLQGIIEAITQDDVPQNPDFVRIMSLHKSKGLTSESVYIVGAISGVLPTIRRTDAEGIEQTIREGRRLLYVAITRAARELTISSSISTDLRYAMARGVQWDKRTMEVVEGRYVVKTLASPYLVELGPTAPRPQMGEQWLEARDIT